MIFASDLDRTLIFSNRFIDNYQKEIKLVEKKEGRAISNMSFRTINLLKIINDSMLFIPVTTRTEAEFNRIEIFKSTIVPKYVVVANGGRILVNGIMDEQWNKEFQIRMSGIVPLKDMLRKVESITPMEDLVEYMLCDDSYIKGRFKKDYDFSKSFLEKLEHLCNKNNYNFNIQRNKLFILPNPIDKWSPIEYIMNKEMENRVISAGDSLLDLPLVSNSFKGYVPRHGLDLHEKTFIYENILTTSSSGIYASDEILENVLQELK